MRMIAILAPSLFYVADSLGNVFQLSSDGTPGVPCHHPEQEAIALRRHAAWLQRAGREQEADEWTTAAERLEALTEPLVAA